MLNLPVPEAEFINEVLKPSEEQQDMVAAFSERAESVRAGMVNPTEAVSYTHLDVYKRQSVLCGLWQKNDPANALQ